MTIRPAVGEPRPFFETPDDPAGAAAPRMLLISYHFPPGSSVGGLRWQQLSRYATERGWRIDVITLDRGSVAEPDLERLAQLPPGTRVYGVPEARLRLERIGDAVWTFSRRLRPGPGGATHTTGGSGTHARRRPASLRREEIPLIPLTARQLVRAYHAWTLYQQEWMWARRAASLALRVVVPGRHWAVVSSGPPHMAHEAARIVARRHDLPFVMDLRDPWSLVTRLPEAIASPLWLTLAARCERRAMTEAALIVANTEGARLALRAAYPDAAARMITVMNGYDEEQIPPAPGNGRFTIAYAGSIYLDRDPRPLFSAAARVIREARLSPDLFGIALIGDVHTYGGMTIADIAREEGIADFVTLGPPRPRREAMEFLAQAPMLVSLPQDSPNQVPSKVFEYMCFDAWLLALAERGSATELVLRDTGADVVAPHDVDGIAAILRERFRQHRAGIRPTRMARDPRFSRRHQAGLLLDALEECVRRAATRRGAAGLPSLGAPARV